MSKLTIHTSCFVVYAPCGKCATGFSIDFGRYNEEDATMLMDGLRRGCKVGYLPTEQVRDIPFGCECGLPTETGDRT